MSSSIQTITSLSQIDWTQFGSKDLIAFDLDETAFTFEQPIIRGFNGYQSDLLESCRAIGNEKVTQLFNQVSYMLIEKDLPTRILDLQESGIEVIGFTARHSGAHQHDPLPMHQRTSQTLTKVGIKFQPNVLKDWVVPKSSTLDLPELTIEKQFKHCSDAGNAGIYDGVLFSNNLSKGYILEKIFDHHQYYPETFTLIDDRRKNLEDVRDVISKLNSKIEFRGYHYLGASTLPDNNVSLEEYLEQKTYFFEHGKLSK
jgi:hypothetical protein